MAMKTRSWLGAGALCALFVFAGCTPNGNSGGGSGAPPPQSAQNQPMAGGMGSPTSGMMAPVFLNLQGPDPVPTSGQVTLNVEIVVNEPVAMPVTLRVLVPKDAQLVGGQPSEVLQLQQAGKLYRQYTVLVNGVLSSPVEVTAEAQHPNGGFGFSARRQYPAATTVVRRQPMRPPVGRPVAPAARP